ncbi:MAG: hypothetical protein ACLQCB_15215 [Spirochaetia bacterium]
MTRAAVLLSLAAAVSAAVPRPNVLSALALDPFLSPSPQSLEAPAVVSMTNDSFGPGPVVEWDDLDSFGLRLGVPWGPARLLAAMSGLTDRTGSEADGTRIDEASLGAAVSLVSKAPVWLSLGGGIDATGNFGGFLIQETFHSSTGVQRPVPTAYSGGLSVAPLASFKLLLASETPLSPYFVAAGRASLLSRGSLLAVAGLRYSEPGALLALGGGWRAAGGAGPATIVAVESAENGPYLGFEMRVGLLALAFEDIPALGKSNGALGMVLGPQSSSSGLGPLSLDLGLVTGTSVAQRVRLGALVHGERKDVHEEAFVAFEQGYYASAPQDQLQVATDTMFSEYSLGGTVGVPFAHGLGHLDVGAGPYVSFEQLSTTMATWSVTLGQRGTIGLAADAGIRVALPLQGLPLGVGWRVGWRALQAEIFQTGAPFSGRGSLDFELYVFSED